MHLLRARERGDRERERETKYYSANEQETRKNAATAAFFPFSIFRLKRVDVKEVLGSNIHWSVYIAYVVAYT